MNLPLETNDCLLNNLMRRAFFLARFAVFSYSPLTVVLAQWQIDAQMQLDCAYQIFQENSTRDPVSDLQRSSPIAQLSTILIEGKYAIKDNVSAHIGFGRTTYDEPLLWDDCLFHMAIDSPLQILSVFTDFSIGKNFTMSFGKIALKRLNRTRDNPYSLRIDSSIDALTSLNAYKIGGSSVALSYPFALQTSVWQQTYAQPLSSISGETFNIIDSFDQLSATWVNDVILSTDYHEKAFNLGYGASLSFVPSEYEEMGSALTASFLVTPFNESLVIATLGALSSSSEASETSVGLSIYNVFSSYQAHYLGYWKNYAWNMGLEYNYMPLQSDRIYGSLSYLGSSIFQNDPVAFSCNTMLSYAFSKGREGYKLDPLSGHFSQKPLGATIGCGFRFKTQKDAFALLSSIGQEDWLSSVYMAVSGSGRLNQSLSIQDGVSERRYSLISIDNTIPEGSVAPYASLGNLNPQGDPEHAFQIKSKSLTFVWNYQFDRHIEWKNELTYTHHEKLIFGEDTVSAVNLDSAYVSSINWYKTATLRTQLSVLF